MPLIAGALLKQNSCTSFLTSELLNTTTSKISSDKLVFNNTKQGLTLIAGKRASESSAEKVITSSQGSGIVLGRLFNKSSGTLVEHIEERELQAIRESQGKWLGERYWGRYLLVLRDEDDASITIYRDPLGGIPLFVTRIPEGVLFSSELPLLYDILKEKPAFDWTYLTSYVAASSVLTTSTPFQGIEEVFPGSYVSISTEEYITGLFWDPTFISSKEYKEKELEEHIIETFSSCIRAWAQETESIALELSGGLDSSALLILMKKVVPSTVNIICFNYFHPHVASSDERNYAAEVAQECNVELLCIDQSKALPLSMFPAHKSNKPSSFLLNEALNKAITSVAIKKNNYEFMSGQGGDHLFLAPPLVESLGDYFLAKGIRGIGAKIGEISAYYRTPFFNTIGQSLKALFAYYRSKTDHVLANTEIEEWMNASFLAYIDPTIHQAPFWKRLQQVYPAKARHIYDIYNALLYTDQGYRIEGKSVINPFLSQPFVELVLSIPTYELYKKEHDRSPFRNAMGKISQAQSIWRKDKGETTGITIFALNSNYKYICELLLEGKFARHNLINKDKLYDHLNHSKNGKSFNLWPLMNLISVELWFESWNL